MTTDDLEIWLKENNLITSKANEEFYNRATEGLAPYRTTGTDSTGVPIMPGTGPHCVQSFSDAICLSKARIVFEIGLNLGHGSAVMLAAGVQSVYSIDISTRTETAKAALVLHERYPGFLFERISSAELLNKSDMSGFDLAFIDGGHELEDVQTDIALCRKLGIKNILFDDWYPEYGPGVQSVIKVCDLKVRAIFGNMCLCCETK